jgi:hypothetical protein
MKRRHFSVFFVSLCVVGLVGCASGPSYKEIESHIPKLAANQGRIWFIRGDRFSAAAVRPEVRLNGEVVGTSVPGGMFFVDRPPGQYEVSGTTEVERKLTFRLAAGEEKYVRLAISPGLLVGRFSAELIDRQTAEVDMGFASYTGPKLK